MAQLSLLTSKRFAPLFVTQFLGAFNDNFFKNALVILLTYHTGEVFGIPSEQMVAASSAVFILPFFLFSAQAGQIADKVEKSRMIRWIKVAEIAIMGLAATGFLAGQVAILFSALFLMGLHSTVFGPVKYSILPQHLRESEMVGGNALVEAGTFIAILLGTLAGGLLISRAQGALYVAVGITATAVLGLIASFKIPAAPPNAASLKFRWNPIPPTWEIFQTTKKNRSVYLSILGVSWFWFMGGALLNLFPTYCKDVLRTDEHVVTLFLATFSVGIAVGSMLCERLSRKRLELGLVPFGSIGISFFLWDLFWLGAPFAPTGPVLSVSYVLTLLAGKRILFDLFMLSVFSGFFIVPLYTLIQTRSEPAYRSRIIAGNNILNALFMVISSVMLVVFFRLRFTVNQVFLILSVINAIVSIYIYTLVPEFFLRFIAWGLANFLYRLRIIGDEKVPDSGPAVLVCNHVTFIDWLVISAGIKRPIRFIMDHNFAKGGFMKLLMKQAKIIPIAPAHENPEILEAAFARAAAELRDGQLVCIFPEGKITKTGEMNPFKAGVERILQETPVPVIPMALVNMWGSFFSREGGRALIKLPKRFWSRVALRIGDPIPAREATKELLSERVAQLGL